MLSVPCRCSRPAGRPPLPLTRMSSKSWPWSTLTNSASKVLASSPGSFGAASAGLSARWNLAYSMTLDRILEETLGSGTGSPAPVSARGGELVPLPLTPPQRTLQHVLDGDAHAAHTRGRDGQVSKAGGGARIQQEESKRHRAVASQAGAHWATSSDTEKVSLSLEISLTMVAISELANGLGRSRGACVRGCAARARASRRPRSLAVAGSQCRLGPLTACSRASQRTATAMAVASSAGAVAPRAATRWWLASRCVSLHVGVEPVSQHADVESCVSDTRASCRRRTRAPRPLLWLVRSAQQPRRLRHL